jgi:nitrite reductase (NO-forming)
MMVKKFVSISVVLAFILLGGLVLLSFSTHGKSSGEDVGSISSNNNAVIPMAEATKVVEKTTTAGAAAVTESIPLLSSSLDLEQQLQQVLLLPRDGGEEEAAAAAVADLNLDMGPGFTQIAAQPAQNTALMGGSNIKKITLVAYEEDVTIPRVNKTIHAMTFNGTIPAPTLRVTQGDVVNITMINYPKNKLIHSIAHDASVQSAVPNFGPVNIGQKKSYTFVATKPGFFKYQSEGNGVLGVDQQVFSGMAGGVIVDPINGYIPYRYQTYNNNGNPIVLFVTPNAKEVALIFSEWYLTKDGSYNQTAMFNHQPTYTSINGIPFGYEPAITKTKGTTTTTTATTTTTTTAPAAMPIHIKQTDHVRFFLLNIGDAMVNFHIVGEQLGRVIDGQTLQGFGKQTYLLGGSNDAIVDVAFTKPGVYAFVNNDYASLLKGQAGLIVVDGPNGQPGKSLGLDNNNYLNPSNAIPPLSRNSIPVSTVPYYLGKPIFWNGQNNTSATTTTPPPPAPVSNATNNLPTPIPPSQAKSQTPVPGSNTTSVGGGALIRNVTTPSGASPNITSSKP